MSVDWDAIEGGGYTETYPIPVSEKDQQYRSVTKPSRGDYPSKEENEQHLVKTDGSDTDTTATLPAPDGNTFDTVLVPDVDATRSALVPDGGAYSQLMTKPDVHIDNEKQSAP
ncbi:hypothetical protein G6F42_025714 [Rhizopus arrhizus]|nr:hypothetical protein G6F42_025714 [Rhizopus arrhizus]